MYKDPNQTIQPCFHLIITIYNRRTNVFKPNGLGKWNSYLWWSWNKFLKVVQSYFFGLSLKPNLLWLLHNLVKLERMYNISSPINLKSFWLNNNALHKAPIDLVVQNLCFVIDALTQTFNSLCFIMKKSHPWKPHYLVTMQLYYIFSTKIRWIF